MNQLLIFLFISNIAFADQFQKIDEYLFKKPDPGMTTEAFVLWHDGNIIFKKFERGDGETLHLLWSMSKSISSILLGIAQDKGLLNTSDPLTKYYSNEIEKMPTKRRTHFKKLRIDHLLHMTSGLAWNEFYEADPFRSHVVNMLYAKSKGSMTNYVMSIGPRNEPGEKFYYSSGDTNIFMDIIKKVVPSAQRNTYPWDWFFEPMEMEAIFEQDGSGTFVGSSYAYLKTKDLIKLGLLVMNKGKFNGKQIVSKDYIKYATSLSPYLKDNCLKDSYMTYGAQFWLNQQCENGHRPFEDIPSDLVMFLGHGGQSVFVIPSKKIIAVRIARDVHRALDKSRYSLLLMDAVKENSK